MDSTTFDTLQPALRPAAGSYGTRLPLSVAAVAHSAAELAADVSAAALAVERVDRVRERTLAVLERAVERLDGRMQALAERNAELARYLRLQPATPATSSGLAVQAARLDAAIAEVAGCTGAVRVRIDRTRSAVSTLAGADRLGDIPRTLGSLAETTAIGVRRAIDIGDDLARADDDDRSSSASRA